MIALHCIEMQEAEARLQEQQKSAKKKDNTPIPGDSDQDGTTEILATNEKVASVEENTVQMDAPLPAKKNKGKLLMDATVAPQNITFPTDLKLLNTARKKSEHL